MQLGKALLCGGDVNLCLLGLVDRVAELAQLEVDLAANAAWRQLIAVGSEERGSASRLVPGHQFKHEIG